VTASPKDPAYVPGYSDDERQRLVEQAQLFYVHTRRLLCDAGIGPGMRVLDVGCGVGDVSMLAASLVGTEGAVVGVDADPRSLALARQRVEDRRLRNVGFAEGDLRAFSFDEPFDAVVGRFILMYLADPVEAVHHVATLVRPGGVVVFQEYQLTFECLSRPDVVPLWDQWMAWVLGALDKAGVEMQMGLKLYEVFTTADLPPPCVEIDMHFLTPADPLGPKVAAHTVRSVLPFIERYGLATAEEAGVETFAERLHADLVARGAVVSWPPIMSARTRMEP